ncbi:MAG: hypothetical protein K6G22_04905, partial [Lachnospiraceae bacterium]|nr:hypothetical protein [Lachnospiraceae bacterium]
NGSLFLRPDFSEPYKNSEYYDRLMNVDITGDYVADSLSIAASQQWYHEGDSFDEMDGSNGYGRDDYAEMAYFTCSPAFRWWPYEEEYDYGGWCGNHENDVEYDIYVLRASDGYNLSMAAEYGVYDDYDYGE